MIKRVLFFPSSRYLSAKWWHRLAVVIFWAWAAVVLLYLYKGLILDPFSACIRVKYALGESSDLNCGTNAFGYALANVASEPIVSAVGGCLFIAAAIYVALLLPSIVYRILLYIAKGGTWRDPASAA